MASRGYQDLNLRIVGNSKYSWGGTDYTYIFFGASDTYPSGIVTASEILKTRANALGETSGSVTFDTIIPTVYDAVSIIDGTISGNLKMKVSHSGENTTYTDLRDVVLNINLVDSAGSSTTISTKTIWSGSLKSTYNAAEFPVSLQVAYWIDVEDIIVNSSERIVLSYEYNFNMTTIVAGNTSKLYIVSTDDTEETSISLPFVM